jgi:hypothetical protein
VLVFGAIITAVLDGTVNGVPLRPDLLGLLLIGAGTAAVVGWRPSSEVERVPA